MNDLLVNLVSLSQLIFLLIPIPEVESGCDSNSLKLGNLIFVLREFRMVNKPLADLDSFCESFMGLFAFS